jgi:DNA-binding beta-propeller fold protein YncE
MRLVLVALLANLLFAQPELFLVDENNKQVRSVQVDPVEVQASFTVPNNPAFFFVNADRTKYYSVSRAATGTVAVLSAAQPSTVLKTLDLAAVTAAAITPDRTKIVIATATTLYRIDTATDTVTSAAFLNAPGKELIFSLDGSRLFALTTQVVMFNIDPFVVVSSTVLPGPLETMAMNHTGLLYGSAPGRVHEIDGRTGQPLRTIETLGRPGRLAFSPSSYVALAGNLADTGPSLFRFDLKAAAVTASLTIPSVRFREVHFLSELRAVALSNQSSTQVPVQVDPLSTPLVMRGSETF